jgi:hypothetical protein
LGLRGEALAAYARQWIVSIEDISEFVRQQAANANRWPFDKLLMPRESVYLVRDGVSALRLGLGNDSGSE